MTHFEDERPCHHFYRYRAQLYSPSGPTPEETGCRAKDNPTGDCNIYDCPYTDDVRNPCLWCGETLDECMTINMEEGDYHPECLGEWYLEGA